MTHTHTHAGQYLYIWHTAQLLKMNARSFSSFFFFFLQPQRKDNVFSIAWRNLFCFLCQLPNHKHLNSSNSFSLQFPALLQTSYCMPVKHFKENGSKNCTQFITGLSIVMEQQVPALCHPAGDSGSQPASSALGFVLVNQAASDQIALVESSIATHKMKVKPARAYRALVGQSALKEEIRFSNF